MRFLSSITIAAALMATAATSPALADVRCGGSGAVRVGVAPPPPLPETEQPPMPAYGYLWTPGSWLWNPDVNDYYWTPGAWILPPAAGLFWTPGYWGWDDGDYLYHAGYWGSHVGFYGGVRYGFGYLGHGYDGGYWRGRTFYYNGAYNNIGALHINALYDHRLADDRMGGRTSYNGGPRGVVAGERADDRLTGRDAHIASTANQVRNSQRAAGDPTLRSSVNHGHPPRALSAVRAIGQASAARPELSHRGTAHSGTAHLVTGHAPAHSIHAPFVYQRAVVVQTRHEATYSHYAPAYRAPAQAHPQPFRGEPQHWAPSRPDPVHQVQPRGPQAEHPRQGDGRP